MLSTSTAALFWWVFTKPLMSKIRTPRHHLLAEEKTIHATWHTFFRNKKFLFVKIECWNFRHLFDLGSVKPCKIPAHSDKHSDDNFLEGIKVVRMSWNFVRFQEILNQKEAKNFRLLSWQTKKFYSMFFNLENNIWK